jgi:sugar phosphate isomerase/epimerase
MHLSCSTITTINAPFTDDVRAYAAAGFDAIGLWEFKLPDNDAGNIAAIRSAGLTVSNCIPTVPSILPLRIPGMEGPSDPEERVRAICVSVRRLAAYDPECVLFLTGPAGDRTSGEAREIVLEGARRIAAVAREASVPLAFEPIHASQVLTTGFPHTIADSVALLHEAGLDEVGVMADTYNLWGEPPEAFATAAHRISGLHVCDLPEGNTSGERLLPGATGGHTREIVAALHGAGWNGSLDVEVFSTPEGLWGLPVDEAARRAYTAARSLVSQTAGGHTSPIDLRRSPSES